jgi:cysteine desulfurase NifS
VPRKRIDLDNNATTPLDASAREAMLPYLRDRGGNPSSIHSSGSDAREGMEAARRHVARLIGARPRRVVFTGGGSEANNLALKGLAFARRERNGHLITSAIEHPSVLKTAAFLESVGFRVTILSPDEQGRISPNHLREALAEDTFLVSIMLANNETGTMQPIRELCAVAHERGVPFHSDAVQAAGKVPVDVEELGVDLLTLSAHKLHGPKGVGALFVRRGIALEPLVHGGSQEGELRAGTENVAGIVGMGRAAEVARGHLDRGAKIRGLRDRLRDGILERIPNAQQNGDPKNALPNTLNLTLPGLRGESLVVALDQRGIALSSGSACKSGSPEPTHVLLAMGRTAEEAHCSVRFSLSRETNEEDIGETLTALESVLEEMETTVRFLPCK